MSENLHHWARGCWKYRLLYINIRRSGSATHLERVHPSLRQLHLAKYSNISLLVWGQDISNMSRRYLVANDFFEQRENVSSNFKRRFKERLFLNLFFLFLNLPKCYKSFYSHKWRVFSVFVPQQPPKLALSQNCSYFNIQSNPIPTSTQSTVNNFLISY